MSIDHIKKGNISEQKFVLYCLENNIKISKPVFNDLRYDFIIDLNDHLYRIQVKTGYQGDYLAKERFCFKTSNNVCTMSQIKTKSYVGDIDYFAVYCEEFLGKEHPFIFVPIEKAAAKEMIMYYGNNTTDSRLNRCNEYYNI